MEIHESLSDTETANKVAQIVYTLTLIATDEMLADWIKRGIFDLASTMSSDGIGVTAVGFGMSGGPFAIYQKSVAFGTEDTQKELDSLLNDLRDGTVLGMIEDHLERLAQYGDGLRSGKIVDIRSVMIARVLGTR